jgi:hypothetical protein
MTACLQAPPSRFVLSTTLPPVSCYPQPSLLHVTSNHASRMHIYQGALPLSYSCSCIPLHSHIIHMFHPVSWCLGAPARRAFNPLRAARFAMMPPHCTPRLLYMTFIITFLFATLLYISSRACPGYIGNTKHVYGVWRRRHAVRTRQRQVMMRRGISKRTGLCVASTCGTSRPLCAQRRRSGRLDGKCSTRRTARAAQRCVCKWMGAGATSAVCLVRGDERDRCGKTVGCA